MELSLDIFRAFVDQKQPQEMINRANTLIQENITNPQFALFILNSYQAQEVQNDQILAQAMLLILFRIIEFIWTKLYPNEIENYGKDTYSQIREGIVSIYLNTPPQFQSIIIESIRLIIRRESNDSEDLVLNICTLINPQQNLHIVSFVLQVLESYSDVIKIVKNVNRGDPFCDTFIQIWLTILPQLQGSFSNQPNIDSFQIVKSASGIMSNLLYCANNSLLKQEISDLIQFFIGSLTIQSNDAECIKMKESVLLFFKESLITTKNKQRRNYTGMIQQAFLESIFQIIPQLFPNISESTTIGALSALMSIFYNMIIQNINLEWFYSPEFVYHFLIPAARLTQNDLEEFGTSPAHYIGFSLSFIDEADESAKSFDIPRFVCARIMQKMITVVPQLFVVDLSQFTNPLDLEAFLYLIYQGYLCRENVSFALDEATYSQIFTLLNTPNLPEYLYPSTLCALQNNIILNNYELLKTISSSAYGIVMNQQMNLVFTVPALSLFRLTIYMLSDKGELESLINIKDFITRLIQISSEINTPEVQIVMKNLIKCWKGPQIREYSRELFGPFSEFLIEISKLENSNDISPQQEDELNRITDTLFLLFKIQVDLNEKQFFAEQIISLSVNILQEYPNSIGVGSLVDLCFDVCQEIKLEAISEEFKSTLVKFIHFIISHLSASLTQEESFDSYLFPNFASVLTTLMPLVEGELLQQTQIICFTVLQNQSNYEETALSAALLVLSDIILVHGANINEITQFAFAQMRRSQAEGEEDQESYFVSDLSISCIFVLTSALFKTEGSFAQFIPEDILHKWFELSNVMDLQNQREIHTFALGLLILANQQNGDAYKVAGDLLYQNFEKDSSPLFEEEEEFCDGFDLQKILLPIDKENVSKLFLQLVEKAGPPGEYSEEFHHWLNQKAFGNQ